MPVVLQRPRAVDDLIEIWDYLAEDSVARADAFIDHVDEAPGLLATQPMLGRSREEVRRSWRSFPSGRYVVFYEVMADGIAIVRVLHSARDRGAQLDEG